MANKIDSNVTGLSFAEEESLGVLSLTPVWYGLEPNGYQDFGGQIKTVARSPINPSRQNKKGVTVDLDASGGFGLDFTQNNALRLLQGFFFADAREKPSSKPIESGLDIWVNGVVAATDRYTAASGMDATFAIGQIVFAKNFANEVNNGRKVITSIASGYVGVAQALADESSTTEASLTVVGRVFAASDISATYASGQLTLTTLAADFTTLDLTEGEWVWLGGDSAGSYFSNNRGFARIAKDGISTTTLSFDKTTFTPATQSGAGVTFELYFGTVLRNESAQALIKRRSYNFERTLGQDDDGIQSEYLEGAVANEFKLKLAQAAKLEADLSFVACDHTQRTGLDGLKDGDRVTGLAEDAYNTTSDVYYQRLYIHDETASNPDALFAYVTEGEININNNVTPNKAIGVLGAFDTSAGNFDVGGSLTAYFADVEAVRAVRNNSDVGYALIMSKQNVGFVWDIPLLSLGNGRLQVEKDQPIKVPLESSGAENEVGYTLMYVNFSYLPDAAMASQ